LPRITPRLVDGQLEEVIATHLLALDHGEHVERKPFLGGSVSFRSPWLLVAQGVNSDLQEEDEYALPALPANGHPPLILKGQGRFFM
jgi:hypothetical protein